MANAFITCLLMFSCVWRGFYAIDMADSHKRARLMRHELKRSRHEAKRRNHEAPSDASTDATSRDARLTEGTHSYPPADAKEGATDVGDVQILLSLLGERARKAEAKRSEGRDLLQGARARSLVTESCPGPNSEETFPAGVAAISRYQNPSEAECPKKKRFITRAGGIFGGNSGVGMGAEMGPAMSMLGNAMSYGRILQKESNETADPKVYDFDRFDFSSVFLPLSTCPVPSAADVMSARRFNDVTDLMKDDLVMVYSNIHPWAHPGGVQLLDKFLFGFSMPMDYWRASASMYLLRLTDYARGFVGDVLKQSLPPDFDPDQAISMPIRGSDKCLGESACFNFTVYMQLAEDIRKYDPRVKDIILTTESKEVYGQAAEEERKGRWRFIFNRADIDHLPNSGDRVSTVPTTHENMEADPTLLAVSSLHLTLRGKYVVLNTNSHWNALIGRLVQHGGCGLATSPFVLRLDQQEGKYLLCGVVNQAKDLPEYNPLCAGYKR